MKVTIKLTNSNEKYYIERAQRIIDLYNEVSEKPFDEELNLSHPEFTKIIYADNDSGGILLDYISEYKIYKVMFAAFDIQNRKKGLLANCLDFAKNKSIDIAIVEVDSDKESAIWEKHGYNLVGVSGLSRLASNRSFEFIKYNSHFKFK